MSEISKEKVTSFINDEKNDLLNVKRPFETAAFLIFGIFFVQQVFYIIVNFIQYLGRIGDRNDWVAGGGATYSVNFTFGNTPNIPAFVVRVLNIDSSKFIWVLAAFLFLAVWYFLIWLLVWNYCRKNNLAKWTWTALIAFGPATILLVPTYLIYAIYVFRPYVFRFIRKGVKEYKLYNENYKFKEDQESDTFEL